MNGKLLAAPFLAAVLVPTAFAGSIQTVTDRTGDASAPKFDVVKATMKRVSGKQVVTIYTRKAFSTYDSPVFTIHHKPYDYFIGGQSNGEWTGTGPCPCPHAHMSRPAANAIRWSFTTSSLHLRGGFYWFVRAGQIERLDRLPNKGFVKTEIPA
jgi:hypothetical protein